MKLSDRTRGFMAFGAGAGAVIGVTIHNVPVGVGIGAALGAFLGFLVNRWTGDESFE